MYSLAQLLRHQARERPTRPFLLTARAEGGIIALSYGETLGRVQALSAVLAAGGIARGDRVAVGCADPVAAAIGLLACWERGAVAAPIHREASADERRAMVDLARARLVITDEPSLYAERRTVSPAARAAGVEPERLDPLAPAELLFTSGSAGQQKGVLLSHQNLLFNAVESVDTLALRSTDAQYCAVAVSHAYGQNRGLLSALYAGASTFFETDADSAARVRHVTELSPSILIGIPALYLVLLAARPGLPSLRAALCGAAPLSPRTPALFERQFGVPLLVAYGMSECGPLITSQRIDGESPEGSVGRPIRGVELRIVDDGGALVGAGLSGTIEVRGPNVMLGYDGARASHLDPEGWFATGDVGRLTSDGHLMLEGRVGKFIKRAGLKVFPAEVQHALLEHGAVLDALVTTFPSPVTGEDLIAYVKARPGARVTLRDVVEHCERLLPSYKRPARIELVDRIPTVASGKPGARP